MGFLLYRTEQSAAGLRYTRVSAVALAGRSGALATWLKSLTDVELPHKWELSGPALIRALLPGFDPDCHTIVLDMEPERLVGATLCKVQRLAGVSEVDETDVVIVMRELLKVTSGSDKADFIAPAALPAQEVLESIGVSGGTQRGNYRWCQPKMNIGAAVCPAKKAPVNA